MSVAFISSDVKAETTDSRIEYKLLEPLPCAGNSGEVTNGSCTDGTNVTSYKQDQFGAYLVQIYRLGIGIGIALAVIMISWGGFKLATTDSFSGTSEGRAYVQNAIYGLLMVLCSYIVLYYIDPRYVNFKANFDTLAMPQYLKAYDYEGNFSTSQAQLISNIQSYNKDFNALKTEYSSLAAEKEAAIKSGDYSKATEIEKQLTELNSQLFQNAYNAQLDAQKTFALQTINSTNLELTYASNQGKLASQVLETFNSKNNGFSDMVKAKMENATQSQALDAAQIKAIKDAEDEIVAFTQKAIEEKIASDAKRMRDILTTKTNTASTTK